MPYGPDNIAGAMSDRETARQDALFGDIYRRRAIGGIMSAGGEGFMAAFDPDGDNGWAAGIGIGLQRGGQLVREGNELDQLRLQQSLNRQEPLNRVADTHELEADEMKQARQEFEALERHNKDRADRQAKVSAAAPAFNFKPIRQLLTGLSLSRQLDVVNSLFGGR